MISLCARVFLAGQILPGCPVPFTRLAQHCSKQAQVFNSLDYRIQDIVITPSVGEDWRVRWYEPVLVFILLEELS